MHEDQRHCASATCSFASYVKLYDSRLLSLQSRDFFLTALPEVGGREARAGSFLSYLARYSGISKVRTVEVLVRANA